MKTNILRKLIIAGLCLVTFAVTAATISRIKTFSDGEILTASDLNAEFDNVVDGVNSITNDNIASNAAISPVKISSAIKGDAIARDSTSGALSVKVDNTTIEVSSDSLRVKDGGITGAKLNANTVDNSTLQYTSNQISVKDLGITTAKINDLAITSGKIETAAVTQAKKAIRTSASSTATAGNMAVSASSGSFSTTSLTDVDVTNLSITITSLGSPVFLGLVSAQAEVTGVSGISVGSLGNGGGNCVWKFKRDGTTISSSFLNQTTIPASVLMFLDIPAAGTYTYKVSVYSTFGGSACTANTVKLIAYEL